jgi:hypothetical protein
LSQKNATGAYRVGGAPNEGFVDGYIGLIPPEWQSALKGPIFSGNNTLSIITRTSYGPAAFAWDPAKMTNVNRVVPSTPLLYYSARHPSLGRWNGASPNNTTVWWNMAGANGYRGAVISGGSRSILFFGAQGMGPFCYGPGTADASKAGRPATDIGDAADRWCYDPVSSAKGPHGWPYQYQIMAFDLNDLAAVAARTKNPWDVRPYAVWPLTPANGVNIIGMNGKGNQTAGGAGYDPTTKRIYFSAPGSDTQAAYSYLPLIHVWQVQQ